MCLDCGDRGLPFGLDLPNFGVENLTKTLLLLYAYA